MGGDLYQSGGITTVNNSIIFSDSNNSVKYNNDNIATILASYSLVSGRNSTADHNLNASGYSANQIFANPGIDFTLKAKSPAIDAGSNAFVMQNTDLAGNPRISNNIVDIGAYEAQSDNTIPILMPANGIIYVKKGEQGNGSSWSNAVGELADALLFAKTNNALSTNPQVKQIWVAGGTYKPMYSPEDGANFGTDKGRDNTFLLIKDVKIYGGFAGTETTLAERNLTLTANKSTLSGDLNGDDGSDLVNNGENAYHVLVAVGDVGSTEINGFDIQGGNGAGGNFSGIKVNSEYVIAGYGGAFYNFSSSPALTNASISGNYASYGGAFCNFLSSPVLTNVTISGNYALIVGGAFYNNGSSSVLTNVTISGNRANLAGVFENGNNSSTKILNSIIYNNEGANEVDAGSAITYQNSLVEGNPNGTDMIAYSGGVNQIFLNPQTPGLNTGGNYSLKIGSPAINKGNNVLYTGLDASTTDLLGNLRLQKGTIDLGAYESPYASVLPIVNGMLYVKKGETGNGSSWASAFGEVADALKFAKTNNAVATNPQIKQIWVAGGTYKPMYSPEDGANFGTDKGRDNTFLLVPDVKIYGGFAGTETALTERNLTLTVNKSTLSGDLNGDDGADLVNNGENAYHVLVAVGAVGSAELNGFIISGGNGNGDENEGVIANGQQISRIAGAFFSLYSSPVLTNITITGNYGGYGGAFCNLNSSPTFTNVTVSGNRGDGGGAFANFNSSAILTNVTINGNNAVYGGAFANFNSSPILTNVTISGNTGDYGGGFYSYDSFLKFRNCIIYNNTGYYVLGSSTNEYTNSLVQFNPTGTHMIPYSDDVGNIFVNPQAPGLSTAGDYRLKAGSPSINKGSNTFYAAGQIPDLSAIITDLAGSKRFNGNAIDFGAYELQSQPQTINPIATITKTYGDTNFEPGGTSTSGLTLTYASADPNIAETYQDATDGNKWKIKIKKAGTVNITASQTGDGNFDPATAIDFSLVIDKKPVTVILNPDLITKVYDANANAVISTGNLALSTGSIIGTDDLSIAISTTGATYDDKNVGTGKVVSIPVANLSLSGTAAGNYNIANTVDVAASVGTITAKTLTVKANNYSKVYDGAPYSGGNGVNYTGFALGDNEINALNGILTYEGTAQQAIVAGTFTIVPKGFTANNYQISYVNGVLTIAPNTVNVLSFNARLTGETVTKTYGEGSINASAIATSNLAVGYQSSNPAVAVVDATGQVALKGVGSATITASQTGNINYNPAMAINFTVQVIKKTLDVKAKDDNKTYSGVPYAGGNGLIYSGFVYGETENVLGGTVTYSGSSQQAVNTGNYPIIPAGLNAANYLLNYISGTLTIQAAGNNVIAFKDLTDGANVTVTYGDGNIDASATASSGLSVTYQSSNPGVATVDANGTVTVQSVGTSTITASQLGDVNHQAAASISFKLIVQKKALTITANNFNKVYDAVAYTTGNDVSYTGFAKGEDKQHLTGTLSYTGTAINAKDVGSYFITPKGYSSNNYAITYQDGSLTITKADLTVTADAKSKVYGDADPALTYQVAGLVGNDILTGSLERTVGENVGSYPINLNTLSAGANYTISYATASFNITKAVLTITAENQQFCQGNGFQAFTVIYAGFKWNDNINSLIKKPTVVTAANGNSPAGSYVLSPSDALSANYNFIFINGTLSIYAKPIPLITSNRSSQLSKGEALVLTASGGTTFLWSNTDGIISGQQTAVLTVRPTVTTTYAVTVGNANGCVETGSITIEVKDDFQAIKANNILTPNGDGINDVWVIENIDMYPNNVVTVFDKGGRILFTQKGYKNTWNGTFRGAPLAENTYYYIIDFGTDKLKQKGFITLIKEQ